MNTYYRESSVVRRMIRGGSRFVIIRKQRPRKTISTTERRRDAACGKVNMAAQALDTRVNCPSATSAVNLRLPTCTNSSAQTCR